MRLYLQAIGITVLATSAVIGIAFAVAETVPLAPLEVPKRVVDRFGGSAVADVIASPTRVEAFGIRQSEELGNVAADDPFADYETITGPLELSRWRARELSRAMLDPTHYISMCVSFESSPQLRLRFSKDSRSVDIMLDLSLGVLIYEKGELAGVIDYSHTGRHRWAAIAKRIFPNDRRFKKASWGCDCVARYALEPL